MCRRPVGRMPLNTLLFFPSVPVANLITSDRIAKHRKNLTQRSRRTQSSQRRETKLACCQLLLLGRAQQFSRDDHALHLARSLVNGDHARVPVHPFHVCLTRITGAPMHLHRFIHHAVHHLARIKLRLGRACAHFGRVRVLQPRRVIHEPPCRLNLRLHVRDHPLNRLKLADTFPKRLALLGVFHGLFQRPLRQPDGLRANANSPAVQRAQGNLRPWPSSPSRFSTGTTQSFSKISTDGEDLCPILSSCRPTRNPVNPGSTRNALIPFPPASGSVFAKTISTPATLPFVTQVFVPLSS